MPIYKTKNENFFKKWSPKMAYVLGFFTADGNMIKNKRGAHFIEFQITDKKLLKDIRKLLSSNHKITIRKRNKENKKWKNGYRLQIGSKEIFNDLLKFGLMPNKSKTINLPNIPDKYLSHFVRGYFDGDGHVSISNYIRTNRNNKKSITIVSGFTSGSKKILEELHNKLKKIAGIKGGTLCYSKGYRLNFSVKDSLLLYKFLYKNIKNKLHLNRKKIKFEKYFKMC